MAGGPSHLETFDHKPKLAEMHGKPMPESFTKGQPIAQLQGQKLELLRRRSTRSRSSARTGTEICELFPHIGSVADEICIIRSMTTEAINHDPAHTFMNTGTQIAGRPSMGSWVTYGLGSEADDLPGFVVLTSLGPGRAEPADRGAAVAQRLPAQPVPGRPAPRQGRPGALPRPTRRASRASSRRDVIDAVNALNRQHDALVDDPEIATRIAQYEMAFQMQASVPELMDLRGRDAEDAGAVRLPSRATARSPPTACWPGGWPSAACASSSSTTATGTTTAASRTTSSCKAEEVDRACAALITDLKQRGMLDETLVVWGGEFGRTPMAQGATAATTTTRRSPCGWPARHPRRHHLRRHRRPGLRRGRGRGHVHDLHATMLHLLGIDHEASASSSRASTPG